jgi:hypothetical protein
MERWGKQKTPKNPYVSMDACFPLRYPHN